MKAMAVTEAEAKTYNGWANYETWAVKLWMDNDEAGCALQHELLEQAQTTLQNRTYPNQINDVFPFKEIILAALLRDYVRDNSPLADTPSMYSDLMMSAINSVDWDEIASHIIDDADQN